MESRTPREAISQFEELIQSAVNKRNLQEQLRLADLHAEIAGKKMGAAEYALAQTVATQGKDSITLADIFTYLEPTIGWFLANGKAADIYQTIKGEQLPDRRLTQVQYDAVQQKKPIPELLEFMEYRIHTEKANILLGRIFNSSFDLQSVQNKFLGIETQKNSLQNSAETIMYEYIFESTWKPFLVQGLERGYMLLRDEIAQIPMSDEQRIEIAKDAMALQKFLQYPKSKAAVLGGGSFIDLLPYLEDACGSLEEVPEVESLPYLDGIINNLEFPEKRTELFHALRFWKGKGKKSEQLVVVEGRYRTNVGEISTSDFMIFVLRNIDFQE